LNSSTVKVRSTVVNWKSTCFWLEIVMEVDGSITSWMDKPGPDETLNLFGLRTVRLDPILTNWFSNWRLTLPAATRLFSRITRVSFVITEGVSRALLAIGVRLHQMGCGAVTALRGACPRRCLWA